MWKVIMLGCYVSRKSQHLYRKSNKSGMMIKSVTWRITASITTFAIVRVVSGKWMIAGEVAALEVAIKMLVYYLHERAWERIGP